MRVEIRKDDLNCETRFFIIKKKERRTIELDEEERETECEKDYD